MKIAIIGIGLIGGSIMKKLCDKHTIFVADLDNNAIKDAVENYNVKVFDDKYDNIDLVILAMSPNTIAKFVESNHSKFGNILITDVCGVKECLSNIMEKFSLNYVGIHPMAGREVGGYFNSNPQLLVGANMIVTSSEIPNQLNIIFDDLEVGTVIKTSPSQHDSIIAYTSQLCHILSNAFAKSPTITQSKGFTGGSFEDLTRVGRLDSNLWLELFSQNRKNLSFEIGNLISNLQEYKFMLDNCNDKNLKSLLDDGVGYLDSIKSKN